MTFELISRPLFLVLELVLVFLLVRRGVWRVFPIFSLYALFLLVSEFVMDWAFELGNIHYSNYTNFYFIDVVTDWIAVFLVLIEIGVMTFKRKSSLPLERLRWIVAGAVGFVTLVSWPVAGSMLHASLVGKAALTLQIQLSMSFASLACVLGFAVTTYALSTGWSGLGMAIGVGLATYDVSHIILSALRLHAPLDSSLNGQAYLAESVIYFSILLYWVISVLRFQREAMPMDGSGRG